MKKAEAGAPAPTTKRHRSESANVFNDLIRAGETVMVEIAHGTAPPRRFGVRDLSRVAGWGLAALGALTIAAYAASTNLGEDRLIVAVANFRGVPPPERLARRPADSQSRQFVEAIRELSGDRDQLMARLNSLERNVGDITSSIARAATAPATAAPAPGPVPVISTPEATPTPAPIEEPTATKSEAKPEFGIDLGRANSVEGLRQLWSAMKSKYGGALEGLRPIVTVREIARAGVELRLVAGPLSNAAAAARLCASLSGATCHPTAFDGQRLALR
jgi:hypothetical protein